MLSVVADRRGSPVRRLRAQEGQRRHNGGARGPDRVASLGIVVPRLSQGKDGAMNKAKFLTVRWNNWLVLGLGIPALIYAVVALSTSLASELGGFIGLVVIGVLY